jgi:hypothetical protein
MRGHSHNSNAGTQNQGNSLGDRSSVRQSKLYRMYESGNGVKDVLGASHLAWDPNQKQGAYEGQAVYDHNAAPSYDSKRRPSYEQDEVRPIYENTTSNKYASYASSKTLANYSNYDPNDSAVNSAYNRRKEKDLPPNPYIRREENLENNRSGANSDYSSYNSGNNNISSKQRVVHYEDDRNLRNMRNDMDRAVSSTSSSSSQKNNVSTMSRENPFAMNSYQPTVTSTRGQRDDRSTRPW